jgi:23S rRNA (uracil1939-C5)-methyltransferase
MQHQHLLPQDSPALRGAVREMSEGFAFTIEGGTLWDGADLFAAVPAMAELWWRPRDEALRLLHSRVVEGEGEGAGASFVQVNAAMAMHLHDFVAASAAVGTSESAIDAYAGTGEIALRLAQSGARVTAIEVDRSASRGAASRLPSGSSAVAARVEEILSRALPADVVVVNPPRAGLDARVPRALNAAEPRPRVLIYVSCDPGTLARDVRRLDRYVVRAVRGFDMFPQTAHVETVCELVPAG